MILIRRLFDSLVEFFRSFKMSDEEFDLKMSELDSQVAEIRAKTRKIRKQCDNMYLRILDTL